MHSVEMVTGPRRIGRDDLLSRASRRLTEAAGGGRPRSATTGNAARTAEQRR